MVMNIKKTEVWMKLKMLQT
jgi:hypothetical protein